MRGDTVVCSIRRDSASNVADILRFITTANDTVVAPQAARDSALWAGPLVRSGTLQAIFGSDTLALQLDVIARDWSVVTTSQTVTRFSQESVEDTVFLPIVPRQFAKRFGITIHIANREPTGPMALIGTGPNTDLLYYTHNPFRLDHHVIINDSAMSVGSRFWQFQHSTIDTVRIGRTTSILCSRATVVGLLPLVEQHEGLNSEPNSHISIAGDSMTVLIRRVAEPAVAHVMRGPITVLPDSLQQRVFRLATGFSELLDDSLGRFYSNVIRRRSSAFPCDDFRYPP